MKSPSSLESLIQALRCLPGVGPKSAQRMAYHLLQRDQQGASRLADAMKNAVERIRHCMMCNTFTEADVCDVCTSLKRDRALLCVIETPADLLMMEQTQTYRGLYFVLMGRLSPLDGIGPEQLGIPRLMARVTEEVEEVILATSPTIEGEATAHFIVETLKAVNKTRSTPVKISRIAHGVPVGGELEMSNSNTLAYALNDRKYVHA